MRGGHVETINLPSRPIGFGSMCLAKNTPREGHVETINLPSRPIGFGFLPVELGPIYLCVFCLVIVIFLGLFYFFHF